MISEETRQKMRLAKLGKTGTCKGKHWKIKDKTKMFGHATRLGHRFSKEHKDKLRLAKLGKKHTEEHKRKIGLKSRELWKNPEYFRKMSECRKGKNGSNWKGGVSKLNRSERENTMSSLEYKLWRKSCMERDNFTCQITRQYGGDLVVHHINNYSDFPELRLAINNGITLSKEAHNKFHKKYGKRKNTIEQLKEFNAN